jgi:hypothetical protein
VPELSVPSTASKFPESPDYVGLIRFLVEPFLELPESLKVDCEISPGRLRVWVRIAFEGSDKGRVFGRGGRNIQAIRAVLEAVAQAAGYSAHLDIYGSHTQGREDGGERETSADRPPSRRALPNKSAPKPRPR